MTRAVALLAVLTAAALAAAPAVAAPAIDVHAVLETATQFDDDAGGNADADDPARITLPSSFPLPNGATWSPCEDPGDLPQVEGMVADARHGLLYAGQEDVGIWRIRILPFRGFAGRPELVDRVREFGVPATFDPVTEECVPGPDPGFGGQHISADVEGLTIYDLPSGRGYLLASSQGDDTFAVYGDEGRGPYLGSFHVTDGVADGVQDSDGAQVVRASLPGFRTGLLVTQDGDDTPTVLDENGEPRATTNFKFVQWGDVAKGLGLRISPW